MILSFIRLELVTFKKQIRVWSVELYGYISQGCSDQILLNEVKSLANPSLKQIGFYKRKVFFFLLS